MTLVELLYHVVAFLVGALAVARLTRLVVDDDWPPIIWLRDRWDRWTGQSAWGELLHCGFCVAPWITLPSLLWAWLSDLHASWWVFHLWLAAAYAASMVVVRDIPPEDR